MILQAAIVLAWVMGLTIAQFIPAPTDLTTAQGYADVSVRYKQVPAGICELDPSVKSYSGYADVAEDEHIFWWFFESRNQIPSEAPLTIWINGGPGSSSMIGLFSELGPCGVDFNGDVYNNPYSWSNASNMLFIDQPVTTGFSYSKAVPAYAQPGSNWVIGLPNATCPDYVLASGSGYCGTFSAANETLTANSTASAAPNFWKTLQGFMGAFPQYSRNSIYLTGESYAGHWIPIFAEYFETQNAAGAGHHIDLQAVMIGNPWMDPVVQSEAYYNFTVSPGNTYDVVMFDAQQTAEIFNNLWGPGNCIDITKACNQPGAWEELCNEGIDYCSYLVEYLFTRSWYDIRETGTDPFPYDYYVNYLNQPSVQRAMGAFTNYSDGSITSSLIYGVTGDGSREDGTIEALQGLLDRNVSVTIYVGDADFDCNWLGVEVVAAKINATGFPSAGYQNITTTDGIVRGQVKQAGKFSFVRVYQAGHYVPFYQPLMALEMFERVLKGSDIATGEEVVTSSYMTIGTAKSTYREGNATVQWSDLPAGATYNTTTNEPNPTTNLTSKRGLVSLREDGVQSGILSRMEKGKLVRMAKKGRSTMKSWLGM